MASDEKLRQEILKLSNLIAASNGGTSSTATTNPSVYSFARTRPPTNYPPHHLQQYPYTTRPPYQPPRQIRLPTYPNPFDAFLLNDSYVNQVFPPNLLTQSIESKPSKVTVKNSTRGRSRSKYNSPYKLDNSKIPSKNSTPPPPPPPPSVVIKQEKVETPEIPSKAPSSIYINPSYLAQVNSSTGELSLSIQSSKTGIRPHFNPAHKSFHLLKNNCSKNGGAMSNAINLTVNKVVQTYPTTNSLETFKLQEQQLMSSRSSVSSSSTSRSTSPLRTKYKLDRRLKRSPSRKASKTKLFKQYSMRMVSTSKLSQSIYQSYLRKAQRQLTKKVISTNKSFMKARSKKIIVIKNGRKSIVHIDGSKFIRKNGGKSLKRVKSKINVIDISGHRFIRKNGGKSLKRLSDSLGSSSWVKCKALMLTHSQPVQLTPGVRLAKSAIQKSKVTLSQRTWKKKQLCMYYNRFGECKRKDNGSCPYIHDRNQLMICPKFIVGKCTNKECKLSHDLKLGRMPPCQFFNKSECSRENCPYPHIKSSATSPSSLNKKPAETDKKPTKLPSTTARKRKISTRKDPSKKTPKNKKDPKSRYYEQAPDSQPIVAIIPRRYRKNSAGQPEVDPGPQDLKKSENPSSIKISVASSSSATLVPKITSDNATAGTPTSSTSSTLSTEMADRRSRLMSKISRLHQQMKKKESTAPHFLPFT